MILSAISQKGGSGKSAICRLLAVEFAANQWTTLLADLDLPQGTSTRWAQRRAENGFEPEISAQPFETVTQAVNAGKDYDLLIIDGRPHSSPQTLQVAKASDFLLLPCGTALDDLEPTVRLSDELIRNGIPAEKLAVCFCRVGDSYLELQESREYVAESQIYCISAILPERTAYRRALDLGRSLTETGFASLNARADAVVQAVVDRIGEL